MSTIFYLFAIYQSVNLTHTECGLITESYVESNQKNLRGHFGCSSSNEVLYFNKQKTNHRLDIQQLGAVFELHGWLTGQNNEINKFANSILVSRNYAF